VTAGGATNTLHVYPERVLTSDARNCRTARAFRRTLLPLTWRGSTLHRVSCGRARPTPPSCYRRGVPSQWIEDLGINDAESGAEAARAAREKILEPARRVLDTTEAQTTTTIVFQGFIARAQCLHEAAVHMTEAENPHAAFTLLRAYAENTAAILYAKDHPNLAGHWWDVDGHGIQIGKITNHARTRLGGFKGIYDQLSQYAHPQARGLLASSSIKEGRTVHWSSAPHFKSANDQLVAYAWVVDLADATRHLLYEFAQKYELGYFGRPARDEPLSQS
jgi:hypothetical protein